MAASAACRSPPRGSDGDGSARTRPARAVFDGLNVKVRASVRGLFFAEEGTRRGNRRIGRKSRGFHGGATRTLPRRGKQRRRRGSRRRGSRRRGSRRRGSRRRGNCRRETPTARKPENPGFPRHENPMTCIARPSVDGIYWATNTSVERRVCEVDARRRMSGASKTTEATWNDKSPAL